MVTVAGNNSFRQSVDRISKMSFAIGVYRPPSEGGSASLLLRVTENCPWNKCTFCEMYKAHPFGYRRVVDIKSDIDTVKGISNEIIAVSQKIGQGGQINSEVYRALFSINPYLNENQGFVTVFNWLYSGGKTAFLQDADTMIMRPHELIEVLKHLRGTLKTLTRVTSYTRSKTLSERLPVLLVPLASMRVRWEVLCALRVHQDTRLHRQKGLISVQCASRELIVSRG